MALLFLVRLRHFFVKIFSMHRLNKTFAFTNKRRRFVEPDLIVLHWTGGEGGAASVWNTLENRKLSVHYLIDANGEVYFYLDPSRWVAYHCGQYNERSIGIEITNRGWPTKNSPRDLVKGLIRGKWIDYLDFFPEQKDSLFTLLELLCGVHRIPKKTLLATHTVSPVILAGFSGICGHYQLSRMKVDPGPRLLQEVADHGFR